MCDKDTQPTRTKRCIRCEAVKPVTAFNVNRHPMKDGYQDACKDCQRLYKREWLEKIRDKADWIAHRRRQWQRTDQKRRQRRLAAASVPFPATFST